MRLRIRIVSTPQSSAEREPFAALAIRPVPRMWTLAGSLVGHVAMIVLLAIVSHRLAAWFQDDQLDWSQYQVEPLRLHLAEPLVFRASKPAEAPEPQPTKMAQAPAPTPTGQSLSAEDAPAPAQARVLRRLELPPAGHMANNAPVILQPDSQPQLTPPPAALPPLAFWARQATDLPKPPPPRETVTPGRTETPSAPPKLAAPPVLAVPNREARLADLNVSLPPAPANLTPALPVANSATSPVRLKDAASAQAASFDPVSGQAANVLAIAKERPDLRDVQVPRGLRNVPNSATANGQRGELASSASATAGTTAAATAGASAGASDAGSQNASDTPRQTASAQAGKGRSGTPPAASSAPVSRSQDVPANSPANSSANSSANSPTGPPPASSPSPSRTPAAGDAGSGGVPVRPEAVAPRPPARGDVTRVDHPSNGNFDVVVMQSGGRDDLPDVGVTLTGSPVYTVYLPVGDNREWLLEYCVPAASSAPANPYQINIDDTGSVTPPYPVSTVIPKTLASQTIPRQIVLHGTLTAAGSLRSVRAPNSNSPIANEILALLSEWKFRPALRNRTPIEVEILLVIPPRG